jgi:nitrogen fixation protein FixH
MEYSKMICDAYKTQLTQDDKDAIKRISKKGEEDLFSNHGLENLKHGVVDMGDDKVKLTSVAKDLLLQAYYDGISLEDIKKYI